MGKRMPTVCTAWQGKIQSPSPANRESRSSNPFLRAALWLASSTLAPSSVPRVTFQILRCTFGFARRRKLKLIVIVLPENRGQLPSCGRTVESSEQTTECGEDYKAGVPELEVWNELGRTLLIGWRLNV